MHPRSQGTRVEAQDHCGPIPGFMRFCEPTGEESQSGSGVPALLTLKLLQFLKLAL